MIHGKKRNGDLFKRLTESWGYTKPETVEEDVTPLDEEMAADTETVTEEEEVQEEGGAYQRDDEELEEIEARATPRKTNGRRPENGMDDRVRNEEAEASEDEEVVEEAEEEEDTLEEAIRRVVKEAIKTIKAAEQGSK